MGSAPSRAAFEFSSDIYRVFLHTGSNIPQAKEVKKWNDGVIKITINPGATDEVDPDADVCQSKVLEIDENISMDTEGTIEAEFWILKGARVGEPKLLKIEIEKTCNMRNCCKCTISPLYIREVTVVWEKKTFRFPVHNYLSAVETSGGCCGNSEARQRCVPYLYVRPGNGTLFSEEKEQFLKDARQMDHENIKQLVQWDVVATHLPIPTFIKAKDYNDLPRFLQFRKARIKAFETEKKEGQHRLIPAVLLNKIGNCFGDPPKFNIHSFTEYMEKFPKLCEYTGWDKADIMDGLKVGKVFKKDSEFARQIIQGPNSTYLKRILGKEISEPWKEAIKKLPKHLIDNKDIATVLKEGRLYEIIYSDLLEGIAHGGEKSKQITGTTQRWYVVHADCLLYQSGSLPPEESFVPIMIRLENKNDGEKETFWHPPEKDTQETDPKYCSWLLAKMFFRCADWGVYSIGTHYARAHAMNEVFSISMYRNLPSAHPLFRLLQPHLQGIIGINAQARSNLIAPDENVFARFMSSGDKLSDLLVNCCKVIKYDKMVIPKDYETRGLNEIKEFLFRDDSKKLWDILLGYVGEMVSLSYKGDKDVAGDTELQNFVIEIQNPGFAGLKNDNEGAGFPKSIHTKEKLIEYLTVIIFNVSCFHTGVNFQINKYLGYLPNAPPSLVKKPPTEDEVVTEQRIMETLPPYEVSLAVMVITQVLGQFSPIERFYVETKAENKLGYIGENMAISEEQVIRIKKMMQEMEKLKEDIAKRNVGMYFPYTVLSPENIPITTQT